jgi:hypothetical protein
MNRSQHTSIPSPPLPEGPPGAVDETQGKRPMAQRGEGEHLKDGGVSRTDGNEEVHRTMVLGPEMSRSAGGVRPPTPATSSCERRRSQSHRAS